MSIVLVGGTSGSVTLQEPAVAGSTVLSLPATTGTVGLTLSQIGMKNRIINGAMVIAQRNAGASVTLPDGNSSYSFVTDRWACSRANGATATGQQSSNAPAGFINSLLITNGTGISVASGGQGYIVQFIEGLNVADLGWGTANAQTVTLSFWVRSSITGTHSGSLFNNAFNRSYPFTYTISSANTWEQKSVTIAGDTTGTWLTTNGRGICLSFNNGSGSSYLGTAGSWSASGVWGATGSVALNSVTGSTWQITGVQLEVGSQATAFDFRAYGTELALCQRYYEQVTGSASEQRPFGLAYAASTTSIRLTYYYKQQKRATPTIAGTTVRVSNATDGTSPTIELIGPDVANISYTSSGFTANFAYLIFNRSGQADYIAFSSEL
jgi:hypothetical protein